MPRRALFVLLLLAVSPATSRLSAQIPSAPVVVRYHYGDNSVWADPGFDDSLWEMAKDSSWPTPGFHSNGVVWLRIHLAVPPATEPLALALNYGSPFNFDFGPQVNASQQIFAGGIFLGQQGRFPPHAESRLLPAAQVFDLPSAPTGSPRELVVALRLWYPPAARIGSSGSRIALAAGPSVLLRSRQRANRLADLLSWIPGIAVNALLGMLGLGLLIFWYWSRRSELFWAALLLTLYPLQEFSWVLSALMPFGLSAHSRTLLAVLTDSVTMLTTVEFIWSIYGFRGRPLRALLHASWVVFNAAVLVVGFAAQASAPILWLHYAGIGALDFFNLITLLLNLRVLVFGPRNRTIAAALAVIPIGSTLGLLNLPVSNILGIPHIDLFEAGAVLAGYVLALMLLARAIRAWRESNALRVEYEAAREVQEQLVVEVPQVAGFHLDTAYKPASQVGGDFYALLPDSCGGLLIVIGDVSGKGLRAAMSVSAMMGALRAIPIASPAAMLRQLNLGLAGRLAGGFVTCCIAHVHRDGSLILANAGHLSPYRSGEELDLLSGLPLGITPDADYSEAALHLHPGDALTFLSDGVVEAQSATGELFGFERTRAISNQPAENIAQAAQAFGQQDDITVLTLSFAPAVARV